MLLNFTMENYRSFRESTTFSMEACSQREHSDILIKKKIKRSAKKTTVRVKPTAVIYGTNASGKTNIFRAIQLMRCVVLCGKLTETAQKEHLELLIATPFLYGELTNPVRLAMEFETDGTLYEYQFSYQVQLQKVVSRHDPGVILEEALSQNGTLLFERIGKKITLNDRHYDDSVKSLKENLEENLEDSTLFLTGGFRNAISRDTAIAVESFFACNFVDCQELVEAIQESCPNSSESDRLHYRADLLKRLSEYNLFGKQKFSYISVLSPSGERQDPCLYSHYPDSANAYVGEVPSSTIESTGTLRILNLFMAIEKVLDEGLVLCLDELDQSIHFNLMISLIKLFHDPEVNKHGAQLIYNTHNPIYMHGNVFRRDQIFIVEKDSETCESELFTLSDFSSVEVRKDHNYLKNYVKGSYSSIPFYDFSSIFIDEEDQDEE